MPTRPCWVEISTRALEDNYRFLNGLAAGAAELLAVVKADAYGHSLALCAPAAAQAGAGWLGVTSVEEGIAARSLCRNARILTLSGFFPGEGAAALQHNLTPVVWEPEQIGELDQVSKSTGKTEGTVPVHIEIDTGMSRQGASPEDLAGLTKRIDAAVSLRIEGIHTHLFAADETDDRATLEQLARLGESLGRIAAAGLRPEWLSVGASAALLRGDVAKISAVASRYGMKALLRPGLALYGIAPPFEPDEPAVVAEARARLKPVLAWKTRIVGVRVVPPGAVVGYNATFVASEPMLLALLPVGYADGLDRRLGNNFSLLVRGERAPLVGRISMDLAVLDVTEIDGVSIGDEVVIVGTQGARTIDADDQARAAGTIPWEVLTGIGLRVPRIEV